MAEQSSSENPDDIEDLRRKLDSANKRIADTYRSYQSGQERIGALERTLAERSRPPLLDQTDGLQEAIQYVHQMQASRPSEEDIWLGVVGTALPEVDGLMNDEEFKVLALAERERVGEAAWKDPVVAIRGLNSAQVAHAKKRAADEARSARDETQERTGAMEIPGGSSRGGSRQSTEDDDVVRIRDMSSEDFQKMRNKVLGS